ncbi:hypothetical protein LOAG_09062 [Loa loa]|uniref:Uncharacterized protein n=1 Tax=Loa loa TaxID=7209 RepID=A0A1S0TU18_LOALO|nr:hypothetical protein LOAG_09062 [Loa loa]EFO19429.1 hypothetical protein LOAG_09062 [Loa loa]
MTENDNKLKLTLLSHYDIWERKYDKREMLAVVKETSLYLLPGQSKAFILIIEAKKMLQDVKRLGIQRHSGLGNNFAYQIYLSRLGGKVYQYHRPVQQFSELRNQRFIEQDFENGLSNKNLKTNGLSTRN